MSHHSRWQCNKLVVGITELSIFSQSPLESLWFVKNQLHVQVAFTIQNCNLLFHRLDNILRPRLIPVCPYTLCLASIASCNVIFFPLFFLCFIYPRRNFQRYFLILRWLLSDRRLFLQGCLWLGGGLRKGDLHLVVAVGR